MSCTSGIGRHAGMWCAALGIVLVSIGALEDARALSWDPRAADAQVTSQPTVEDPRTAAHSALNAFMELFQRDDAESRRQMAAYLDPSSLDEEARSNVVTLARRLAAFMAENEIATKQKYEALKLDKDASEHCLYETTEVIAETVGETPRRGEGETEERERKICHIRLVRQPDGRWQFDAATVKSIDLLTAKKTPATIEKEEAQPQPVVPAVEQPAAVSKPLMVPPAYASPQATMGSFLQAMDTKEGKARNLVAAAACLNLRSWGLRATDRQARLLANALLFVLDRSIYVQLLMLPNDPDEKSPYLFTDIRERWSIELEREADGRWLFSEKTIENLREMCRAIADAPPLVSEAPELSFTAMPELWLFLNVPKPALRRVWGLELWQWLGLMAVIFAGVMADRIARKILRRISAKVVRRLQAETDTHLEDSALRPIGLVILGYVWLELFQVLWLPKTLGNILTNAAYFVLIIAGIWATYRVIDVVSGYLAILASRTTSKFDVLLVPFGRKILKVIVTIGGLVYFASRLYPDRITALLGGLGLGGLAFALAAQDTIKNLFGSITVMLDRPFEIGDWIKTGEVEGTVESVGFRSTRIRTFYNSQVNIPNGKLIDAVVDNLGRRRFRRIRCKLGLTYDTPPEKIEAFCEGVRELIRRHPFTRKDYYHVYLNEFSAYSLDVLLYCFHEAPDWGTELRERHRLFCDILRLASQLGVEFAFPTRTLHMHQEDGRPTSEPMPPKGAQIAPDLAGRSEAAVIAKTTVPPPETLGPVEISPDPQPVDEAYVKERLGHLAKDRFDPPK